MFDIAEHITQLFEVADMKYEDCLGNDVAGKK
jgi:hypothetical protein